MTILLHLNKLPLTSAREVTGTINFYSASNDNISWNEKHARKLRTKYKGCNNLRAKLDFDNL